MQYIERATMLVHQNNSLGIKGAAVWNVSILHGLKLCFLFNPKLFNRWKTLSIGQISFQWITQLVSLILIHWKVIYPLNSEQPGSVVIIKRI